jgi:16S rRNA (uracil1498-N3)-methyltransferase
VNPALRGSAAHVFVSSLDAPQLTDDDEHHLRKVLRIRDADVVTLSDGAGSWVTARLTAGGLEVTSAPNAEPAPARSAVMTAIPKGDRPEWIVQKLTEIGIATITFVDCARSVVRWDDARAGRQLDRLRRVAREAAMQSRRVWLPDVSDLVPFAQAAAIPRVALADPDGDTFESGTDTILVGPEGGFTQGERDLVARRVRLSEHVLRVETAALAAGFLLTLSKPNDLFRHGAL